MSDLAFAGLVRQAQLVRDGEVSSRELVELSLNRIERFDPQLNAFGAVYAERALAESDAPRPGPLSGVPVAVKDELDIGGEITSRGTGAIDTPAPADSEVVRRLRAAGAVIANGDFCRRGQNSPIASFTQSAGLPSTAQPRRRSPSNTSLAISGARNVIEWPTPLCSIAGATTVTSPNRASSRSIAARPGA